MINFSQAADNNKQPILEQLEQLLSGHEKVLEIGSGAGQHAITFTSRLPGISWQPSDRGQYFEGLGRNISELAPANVLPPLMLDLTEEYWELPQYDCLYAANVIHIVSTVLVESLMTKAGQLVPPGGKLVLYGPYKYKGEFTTDSNANFDNWLKAQDVLSGIRDFEWINQLAGHNGFLLENDIPMPANNQMLVFSKK